MASLSRIYNDKHEVSVCANVIQPHSELLAVSEAEGGARRSRKTGEKEKALMKRVERKVIQPFRAQVGNPCVHKKQLKSEIITSSSKGKDVCANERTRFSELQRNLRIPFLKMIK